MKNPTINLAATQQDVQNPQIPVQATIVKLENGKQFDFAPLIREMSQLDKFADDAELALDEAMQAMVDSWEGVKVPTAIDSHYFYLLRMIRKAFVEGNIKTEED